MKKTHSFEPLEARSTNVKNVNENAFVDGLDAFNGEKHAAETTIKQDPELIIPVAGTPGKNETVPYTINNNPEINSSALPANKSTAESGTKREARPRAEADVKNPNYRPEGAATDHKNGTVAEFLEEVPEFYLMRAEEIIECREEVLEEFAIETACTVKNNTDAGWLLVAIAAHRLWWTAPASGGGRGIKDVNEEGRKKTIDNFAQKCRDRGTRISPSTLRRYVRQVEIFIEEPLRGKVNDGAGEDVVRKERLELVRSLFAIPKHVLTTSTSKKNPFDALSIFNANLQATGKPMTEDEFKSVTKHLKNTRREDAHFEENESGAENGEASPAAGEASRISSKTYLTGNERENQYVFEHLSSEIKSEIKKESEDLKIEPEKLKKSFAKLLFAFAQNVQNMEVQ